MKEKTKQETEKMDIPEDVKDALKSNNIFNDVEDENETSEGENIEEIIKTWLDDKFIHAKTRLTGNQVVALTILKTLAEKYDVKCIKTLLDNFVRYKLSEGGQSSKELVEILKSRNEIEDDSELEKAIQPFMK